ncbi:MAG TPA: sigma-70 family RNA polymerase sigma factor [Lacipirellulaceae bacterium]|nr:sigma-70 family RNA polymerase sigma factor [Lacipirellulaceae bacterium]
MEIGAEDEDRQLLVAIAAGDEDAFRAFYHRYSPTVLALSKRIIGREHDAEDVVADVFWELWEKSSRYCSSKSSPATYLFMLTRCRALDRKRGISRREASAILEWMESDSLAAVGDGAQPAELSMAEENRQLIADAVNELEPNLRKPIELAFFNGLTHRDTAEALGVPLGTTKARIRSALERLRHALRACKSD